MCRCEFIGMWRPSMTGSKAGRAGERGGALLAVLWMSAALAVIAFSVSTTVRSEIDRVSSDSDGLRAQYLASGSVERGIQWMMWGRDNPGGKYWDWETHKPRLDFHYPSGDVVVEMIPESAKLNVNRATLPDLVSVIQSVGGPQVDAASIANAILEWRGGAKTLDSYYLGINPTFRPRHASLQEIEELLSVRGMTPELFYGNFIADEQGRLYARGGLRDCLSVRGESAPYDANTARAERIVEMRKTRPFRTVDDLRAIGITSPKLGVGSTGLVWTLRASARLRRPDGTASEVVRSASATVRLLERDTQDLLNPVHVLRYYEDAWSQFNVAPGAAR
jgi:general secretion pathway protein K